ncbi:MAG: hypothetical protein NTV52_05745, partial [Acidobacteria bacterium]|nr:hypothetical protein [Acidobacteriota bacterium]
MSPPISTVFGDIVLGLLGSIFEFYFGLRDGKAMRLLVTWFIVGMLGNLSAQDLTTQVRALESKGKSAGARDLLATAVRNAPNDPVSLAFYAEFLDRHGDPAAREAHSKLLALLEKTGGDRKQV